MKCANCGTQTKIRRVEFYNYKESGLSNLYLGGIEVIECKKCEVQCPILPSVLDLFSKVAEAVVLKPTPLNGEEAKFLRKQAGYPAKAWATLLDIEPSVLSRWENGKSKIGPQSDRLIRLAYIRLLEERGEHFPQQEIMPKLAAIKKPRTPAPVCLVMDSKYPFHIDYAPANMQSLAVC